MNKTIIIILFVVIGAVGLMWWGKSIQTSGIYATKLGNSNNSSLTASEKLYDFGKISMKNGDVTKEFVITNPTDKDIFIPSLTTSCMCTKAFIVRSDGIIKGPFGMLGMGYVPPANETIKAGESRIIRVVYDPKAHGPAGVGRIDRFVTLSDETGRQLQLEIKALVTP